MLFGPCCAPPMYDGDDTKDGFLWGVVFCLVLTQARASLGRATHANLSEANENGVQSQRMGLEPSRCPPLFVCDNLLWWSATDLLLLEVIDRTGLLLQ